MKQKRKILIALILLIIIISIFIVFNKRQNVNKIYPSVVHLECKNDNTSTVGSGIVYESRNNVLYIVTNYHIIKGYARINVYDSDFNHEIGKVINYDEKSDIAILAIENSLNVKKANFDLNNKISRKENVYILTSFRGKDSSYIVKDAIISKESEKIKINGNIIDAIKLSYNIENGDSGSPVINKKGKVIGMIFLKDKEVLHYGYAIPISTVIKEIKNLVNNSFNNLNLGALMTNSTNTELIKEYKLENNNIKGVVILSLKERYPLYKSGLKKGDIIVEFDNKKINNIEDLKQILTKHKKNDEVSIRYYRKQELIETNVKLSK